MRVIPTKRKREAKQSLRGWEIASVKIAMRIWRVFSVEYW